jgi:hypothetical protein
MLAYLHPLVESTMAHIDLSFCCPASVGRSTRASHLLDSPPHMEILRTSHTLVHGPSRGIPFFPSATEAVATQLVAAWHQTAAWLPTAVVIETYLAAALLAVVSYSLGVLHTYIVIMRSRQRLERSSTSLIHVKTLCSQC